MFYNCSHKSTKVLIAPEINIDSLKNDSANIKVEEPIIIKHRDTTDFERIVINHGLVNIADLDSTIKIDIKYATVNNFMKIDMYGDFDLAYLQPYVASKLVNAQKFLKDSFPDYSLIVFDAVRPRSIQQLMWDSIKVPASLRPKYLSNPKYGSLHNYGAAVDVSIVNENNKELDMATPFDSFEELAYPVLEKELLRKGKITQQQINNRKLLRYVMSKAGFFNIQTEWWHFNSCYRKVARTKYPRVENHILPKLISENTTVKLSKEKEEPKEIYTGKNSIRFKVQIKTSTRKISTKDKMFKDLKVNRYYHKGLYKYTSGNLKDFKDARKLQNKLRAKGYNDCFVAGFNNNKRISIKSAIELMQN